MPGSVQGTQCWQKSHCECPLDDLMTVEKGILCACCLSACYSVVLLGLVKGLVCSKHGIIVRWVISLDKRDL